jgi:mycoredoxin
MLTVYSTTWCGYCARLKKMLDREGIDYAEVNIEEDEAAAELVMSVNGGNRTVPTVVFPGGKALTNPSIDQVKQALAA